MIQNIICYALLIAAIIYMIHRLWKQFYAKGKCESCTAKCPLKGMVHPKKKKK